MSTLEAIESIQATLEPLGALQGEHTQLETWVHHSFESLERLHEELVEWQSELARKQTELDLREDSLEKIQTHEHDLDEQAAEWSRDLETSREEVDRLGQENKHRLEELENLAHTIAKLTSDLETEQQRAEQLAANLESEREHSSEERDKWTGEISDLRNLLEKQYGLFSDQVEQDHKSTNVEGKTTSSWEQTESATQIKNRNEELKKRAQSRRAAKRLRLCDEKDPNQR